MSDEPELYWQRVRDERDRLRVLVADALDDYADHQSWRCGHPNRYDLGRDCYCDLHEWRRKVIAALGETPCRTCQGAGAIPGTDDPIADGWTGCNDCGGRGR